MSRWEIKRAALGSCDVIEAEFVFGPQRCMRSTEFTTQDDGETFYICKEHIVSAGAEVPS